MHSMTQRKQIQMCIRDSSIIQALSKSALCKEFTQDELLSLLEENNTEIKKYEKGSFVFEEGDVPDRLYVLIYGLVEVSKLTFSGKKILITTIENPGDMFAEVYMFMGKSKYDMSAQTGEESLILSISSEFFENISYNTNALAAEKIRKNLMSIFAMKAYNLSGKVRPVSYTHLDVYKRQVKMILFHVFRCNISSNA